MQKTNIPLDTNETISIDEMGVFKSTVNFLKEFSSGNYINASAEALNSIENLKINSSNGKIAWSLINRSLIKTTIDLLIEKLPYFTEIEIETSDIDKQFNHLIKDDTYVIDDTFFDKPHEIKFIIDVKKIINEFYSLFELEEFEITNILDRFDSYFTYSLINEYRNNYNEYSTLKDVIKTPFTNLEKRNIEWKNYNKWLEKQINENIFDESFSLKQIYIPLKACYKEKNKSIDSYEHEVFDIKNELFKWIENKEPTNALKVVRGGPGFGKSSFFKMLANKLATKGHKVLFIPLHRIDIDGDMISSINNYLTNTKLLNVNPFEEDKLILIFDGLDELSMQGKTMSESAKQFVNEINKKIIQFNHVECRLQVIISGRDVVIQQNKSEFRKEKEIIRLLPYYTNENQIKNFENLNDVNNLLVIDQRDLWWNKYSKLKNKDYSKLPEELKKEELDEITSQPLLNYLIALSYDRGEINFSEETNLNIIYKDLLIGVFNRKYDDCKIHKSICTFDEDDFISILEEIGYCTWIGDGRKTTIKKLENHFKDTGLDELLKEFIDEAEKGIFSLLTSFYFKKSDNNSNGDETFEFTHKSFGEYLTAKKLVNELVNLYEEYNSREKDRRKKKGKSLEDCLIEWINYFGYKEIDGDLHKFIDNEIKLLLNQYDLLEVQTMLVTFIDYSLGNNLPIEKTNFKNTFKESTQANINSQKALLIFHGTIATYTKETIQREPLDRLLFSELISNLCPQTIIGAELIKKYFNNLNLGNAKFVLKELTFTNFSNSNLENVDLFYANLLNADLKDANLKGANLVYANLEGADFEGANLEGADFEGANLEGINLKGANLTGANFEGTNLESIDFEDIDLSTIHKKL